MRTAGQITDLSAQLVATSNKLKTASFLRVQRIAEIKASEGRTMDWITAELAKVGGIEAIQALHAQVKILEADMKPEIEAWSNLGQVLRLAAMPHGANPERAAVLALLREEAEALESDPAALQAALEDAAASKDWERVYAFFLGRLDADGSPLPMWGDKVRGLRFDSLDLPGQEAVAEALYKAKVARLEADLAFSDAKEEPRNYTSEMLLIRAGADFEREKFERRQRLAKSQSEALQNAEESRTSPGARFVQIEAPAGSFAIFDNLTGGTHFVGEKEGPAYLRTLNDPTSVG